MKIYSGIIILCCFLISCTKGSGEMGPGEKYIVDTMMAGSITRLDQQAKAECDRRRDSLFKVTYDSIFNARAADIQLIRQTPIK